MDVSFHALLRLVHIGAGSLGLLFFWIPIFAKKGGRVHLAAGRVFVWLSMVIVATAVVSCVWALVSPIHFSGITRELTAGEIEHLSGRIRFFFSVLGVLTTWFVASMRVGIRAVRTRKDPSQLGDRLTRVTVAISVLASIAAILGGATMYYATGELRAFALVGLGVLGPWKDAKLGVCSPRPSTARWIGGTCTWRACWAWGSRSTRPSSCSEEVEFGATCKAFGRPFPGRCRPSSE